MGAAGDEAEGRLRAEPVEHRLQPVRGAIEVEGIGGADDQVDLAVEVGLEARPVALDDMSNIVVLAPVSGDRGVDRAGRAVEQRTGAAIGAAGRSEEHTSELQSLMRSSYAVFCLKNKTRKKQTTTRLRITIQIIHSNTTLTPTKSP